jgi:hypothetical protein
MNLSYIQDGITKVIFFSLDNMVDYVILHKHSYVHGDEHVLNEYQQ